jgi:RNA polymerase subunit RPABC4/transcription elongation factor Spt4
MTAPINTTWTLDDRTMVAIIMADLDRTCCLCEATYDARTMAEELRHNEYCPKCMEEEFGADWADLTATEEQKYGKEGKNCHDSTGKGKGSGTHQQADDDGSTCCSDEDTDGEKGKGSGTK